MASDKEKVATHEAGHALAILMSPFRQDIVHVGVYRRNGQWLGYTVVLGDRNKVDLTGVFEFAKDLRRAANRTPLLSEISGRFDGNS